MPHYLHLTKEKKFKKIIEPQPICVLTKRKNVYLHLCNSIMSQQLSVKVADVFQRRFLELYNNKTPTPLQIANTNFDTLRGIGLSNAKANYVINVCNFFIANKITDAQLYKMTNHEIIKYLTQIKGVGQWTVEMILMFTLGREDIFAIDDLGIQQAMCKLYNIDATNKKNMKEKMLHYSKKWSPYRTYACRYLWGWKDNVTKV
ncbi:MAG: DNA-3-methyladenine glycosylase 2 family protein [Ferruginibacter sp.]|nr:DNA-3-methyladenine glycosylase 2 family protein [Ferruginibacter sp.]